MIEELNHRNYLRVPRAWSQFVPWMRVDRPDLAALECPRCKTSRAALGHGKQCVCERCGLHMQLFGNALRIWA